MAVEVYLSEEKIKTRIKELGAQITKEYAGEEIHIVCVLNGAFMFMADLVREIKLPVILDFISASSYGDETVSSGELKIKMDLASDVAGKHVLLVEDIVDTGLTMKVLRKNIEERGAKSVKLASFLFKPARLEHETHIDYLGFEIEDHFVIGYGLDFAGRYRELPYIGIYSPDQD
ncbi:MAG: hypoxanthine phosphoribosyltransferase [Halobacteriovoraceae bacterium]|nr:hypoxanthine phosphoribosyltransferase [Halobacteriovoraceae bacterium]|tara:strand:+ start:128 stop:652 length:525 start_codon:yes stop_codon:yes gene_type:complete